MSKKVKRSIIRIDEEKCDGCGLCAPACAEGAIQIIDGKARLVSDKFCDGLGACLGECPQDAITIEEREAEEFDEETVRRHSEGKGSVAGVVPAGCPSTSAMELEEQERPATTPQQGTSRQSLLRNWPVQLALVPPTAPFLKGADVLLVADCVPFAYDGFHQDFLDGHVVLVACPKLDDFQEHARRLSQLVKQSEMKSITVVYMEVPCCARLVHLVKQAMISGKKDVPLKQVRIGIKGDIK